MIFGREGSCPKNGRFSFWLYIYDTYSPNVSKKNRNNNKLKIYPAIPWKGINVQKFLCFSMGWLKGGCVENDAVGAVPFLRQAIFTACYKNRRLCLLKPCAGQAQGNKAPGGIPACKGGGGRRNLYGQF